MTLTIRQRQAMGEIAEGVQEGKRIFMVYGGSGAGKTYLLTYILAMRFLTLSGSHYYLRATQESMRKQVWLDMMPTVLRNEFQMDSEMIQSISNNTSMSLANDASHLHLAGLKAAHTKAGEDLLGNSMTSILIDEATQADENSYTMLLTRLRSALLEKGVYPIILMSMNPPTRSHWIHRKYFAANAPDKDLIKVISMKPGDNEINLGSDYINQLKRLRGHAYTRFFEGNFQDSAEGALWNYDMIQYEKPPSKIVQFVIGVDPAGTYNSDSDLTGLVLIGKTQDGMIYIMDDFSMSAPAMVWISKIFDILKETIINTTITIEGNKKTEVRTMITIEGNHGGKVWEDMVRDEAVKRKVGIKVKTFSSREGKLQRAEPIANMYINKEIKHAKPMVELEDQMMSYLGDGKSPDRMDAMVFAVNELRAYGSVKTIGFSVS